MLGKARYYWKAGRKLTATERIILKAIRGRKAKLSKGIGPNH